MYFDYAATTPLDPQVLEAMLPHLQENWGNPSSPHAVGRKASAAIDSSRLTIADLTGYKPAEIIFTASGSEAVNLAIKGLAAGKAPGHIVTSSTEHKAVLRTLKTLENAGWTITRLPVDSSGIINLNDLTKVLSEKPDLVTIHWANNETGALQPINDIISCCRDAGVPCHLDAMQCIGILPWPAELPDMMSIAAHKFYGPKGSAALFARENLPIHAQIDGGGQEHGLRSGTENVAGIVGLTVALQNALEQQQKQYQHLSVVKQVFIEALPDSISLRSVPEQSLPSICSLELPDCDGATAVARLDLQGYCVSTGSACTTGANEASHVLQAMGLTSQEALRHLRISFGRDSSAENSRKLAAIISDL